MILLPYEKMSMYSGYRYIHDILDAETMTQLLFKCIDIIISVRKTECFTSVYLLLAIAIHRDKFASNLHKPHDDFQVLSKLTYITAHL